MLRLIAAELRRLVHRRLVLFLLLAGLLGGVALGIASWRDHRPPSEQQVAQGVAQYEQDLADWQHTRERDIQFCRDMNALNQKYHQGEPEDCSERALAPQRENYIPRTLPVSALATSVPYLVMSAMLALGLVVGASFVGAEFGAGTMASWLVLEPRRGRVYAAKVVALALFMLATGLVTALCALSGVGLVAWAHHLPQDMDLPAQRTVLVQTTMAVLLGTCAALAAAGVAFLTRHTAAVVALAGLAGTSSALFETGTGRTGWASLVGNIEAWVGGQWRYTVRVCNLVGTDCDYPTRVVERPEAVCYLGALTVVALLAGWSAFSRRDVS